MGGCGGGGPSLEVAQASGEGWVDWGLGGSLVPCLFALGGLVMCPAWDALWGGLEAWEELLSSLAMLDLGWGGWGGELWASEWSCAAPGGELLPSPGGRWAIASVWMWEETWLIVWLFACFGNWGGELLASEGSCTAPGGVLLPSPGGRWAIAGVGRWRGPWLIVWLFTWFRSWGGELLASEWSCAAPGGELLPSPGGRWAIAGVGRWGGPDWLFDCWPGLEVEGESC